MPRATKWVYLFSEGNGEMRDLLGGKGAGCAEMTRAGMPVPPGFTITTQACNQYLQAGRQFPEGLREQVQKALAEIEKKAGKRLGDPQNPLLVSVRSGARDSMPGMMDTVLNLGLNDETVQGLARLTGNERFALDAYRRFIQMFSKIVLDLDPRRFEDVLDEAKQAQGVASDAELTPETLRGVVERFRGIVREATGQDFPTDPMEQLWRAIEAVFQSWNNRRAIDYRNLYKIPHNLGTAVNVQTMVFGNMGEDSGTGVAFTRNPLTGEKELYGDYLPNAQGEDVVAGIRTPLKIPELQRRLPRVYRQFTQIASRLERHYRDMQDMEFTVERGTLYMLQTRSGKRTAAAAVKIAVDMVNERLIKREEALTRVEPEQLEALLHKRFAPEEKQAAVDGGRLLARGLNASPGAAIGKAVFDPDRAAEMGAAGEDVILVRPETSPDDFHGMVKAAGILTQRGGATSHAAVVARGLDKPCVTGCEGISVDLERRLFSADGRVVHEGDLISIDGGTGEVIEGSLPVIDPELTDELSTLLGWADKARRLGVWANADYGSDARAARERGAEGIGLCRTEHMFREEDRLPLVRQMILSAEEATAHDRTVERLRQELSGAEGDKADELRQRLAEAETAREGSGAWRRYHGALEQLRQIQKGDFEEIFRAMDGLPVIIRLLDPPLHEFLPSYEELLEQVTELRVRGDQPEALRQKQAMLETVGKLREFNPMLGLRGCRLGIKFPAINEMQVRAILQAAISVAREGVQPHPEIMIPLIGHVNELKVVHDQLRAVAEAVEAEHETRVDYKFGTMIEIPRAAMTAGQIAEYAEFFSFGTNDLTQTIFGISRDDAEGKFLLEYVERGILPVNPFQTLDPQGVGEVMRIGVEQGRATRPDLEIGICGEHGGDPASVELCHKLGLNYVSCSPYRVPVARLAAAQAALREKAARVAARDGAGLATGRNAAAARRGGVMGRGTAARGGSQDGQSGRGRRAAARSGTRRPQPAPTG